MSGLAGKIVILSAQSSAGRTLFAWKLYSALQSLQDRPVHLMGYDLQKPDLLALLQRKKTESSDVMIQVPKVDRDKCRFCGACITACDCGALRIDRSIPALLTDPEKCEACGDCEAGCNLHGISYKQRVSGQIYYYKQENHQITVGQADEKEEFLLPLICSLNRRVNANTISICDSGPGMGGDVLTLLREAHFAIILVYPEDKWDRNLSQMMDKLREKKISFGLIVNRFKGEEGFSETVAETCFRENIPYLGTIPFKAELEKLEKSFNQEDKDPEMASIFAAVWDKISMVVS